MKSTPSLMWDINGLDKAKQANKEKKTVIEKTIDQKILESKVRKLFKTFKNNLDSLTKLNITKETWNLCFEAMIDTTVDIANALNEYCERKYIEITEGGDINESR